MRDSDPDYWTRFLQAFLHEHIPLTREMDVRITAYDGMGIELTAPLAPNVNDKGTGFGGSISALLTLAGWGLLYLNAMERDVDCDIVIQKGEIAYLRPVRSEFSARCRVGETGGLAGFFNRLQHRGQARIELRSEVFSSGEKAAVFDSHYVATLRRSTRQS